MRNAVILIAFVLAVGTVATGSEAAPIPGSAIGLWGPSGARLGKMCVSGDLWQVHAAPITADVSQSIHGSGAGPLVGDLRWKAEQTLSNDLETLARQRRKALRAGRQFLVDAEIRQGENR